MATATGSRVGGRARHDEVDDHAEGGQGQERHQSPAEAEGAGGVVDEGQAEGADQVDGAVGEGGQGPRLGELVDHDHGGGEAEHQPQPADGIGARAGRAAASGCDRIAGPASSALRLGDLSDATAPRSCTPTHSAA